ncbi:MAG: signal peptidase II [Clostridia bacterium]
MRQYGWIAVLALVCDRFSKGWAKTWLRAQPGGTVPCWPGVLSWTYAENRGMAFSMLSGRRFFLIAVTSVVLIGLLLYLCRKPKASGGMQALLWLLWGGAMGNLIDRVLWGYVVDFIEIRLFRFAIFNVADSCVSVAAFLLAVMLLVQKEEKHGAGNPR